MNNGQLLRLLIVALVFLCSSQLTTLLWIRAVGIARRRAAMEALIRSVERLLAHQFEMEARFSALESVSRVSGGVS
jgi:hypothetical protein